MMKILRITTLLDFGGQERKYISFTEKPDLLNHQYIFAAIGYGGHAEKKLQKRGFETHILNRNFSIKNLSNIITIYNLIKKINPDVVHTAAAEANFHGIIAAKLAGVPYIIGEEIGIPNHSNIAKKIFKLVYKLANKVICVSKAVKNHLIEIDEITNDKGIVIYNPVSIDSNSQNSQTLNEASFRLVYVGRLEKVKNVATLINALANIKNLNISLDIVGDGRERKKLEEMTIKLGIQNLVNFVGFSNTPHKYLQNANLFVLPSFSEGFGIAVVEAMLMKVPVLCSQVGGIPEFVKEGETGWLFDPYNTLELTQKIEARIHSKSKTLEIGLKGFESVQNKFKIKNYIQNLESLYENK